MMKSRRTLPNRATLMRLGVLRDLITEGDAPTLPQLAEALAGRAIPPPSRRLPWEREGVLRLLRIVAGWHAGLPPNAGAADKLRSALRLLSEDVTREQLGMPSRMPAAQRRAMVIIFSAKSSGRRQAVDRMLADMAPEVGRRWTLAELLEAAGLQRKGVS